MIRFHNTPLTDPFPLPESLLDCRCCPRECRADRFGPKLGYCGTGAGFQVGAICLHRGEEPVIGGDTGICNIFFTRCSLQCVYCQNYQISRNKNPEIEYELTLDQVIQSVEAILDQGAFSLGFVSPSHVIPQVGRIITRLWEKERFPVTVYNTHAYDRVESLKALAPLIRVWLPDLKYMDEGLALSLSNAPGYPAIAGAAIREMVRQKGLRLKFDSGGTLQEGVIVRHLVLPGQVENSRRVLRFLAEDISPALTVSLMAQYSPTPLTRDMEGLSRGVTREEYDAVLDELDFLGFENGWVQDLDSRECYRPDFRESHPFEP